VHESSFQDFLALSFSSGGKWSRASDYSDWHSIVSAQADANGVLHRWWGVNEIGAGQIVLTPPPS
jgi:hypothetical protein